jgi:hypothetical protein
MPPLNHLKNFTRALTKLMRRELGSRIGRAAVGKTADEAVARAFVKERPGLYAATVRSYRLTDPTDPELQAVGREVIGVVLDVFASYALRGDDALHAVREGSGCRRR